MNPPCRWKIKDDIKQDDSFSYLGGVVTADGKCDKEIQRRIALFKVDLTGKDTFLKINIQKIRIRSCYVWSVLSYRSRSSLPVLTMGRCYSIMDGAQLNVKSKQ